MASSKEKGARKADPLILQSGQTLEVKVTAMLAWAATVRWSAGHSDDFGGDDFDVALSLAASRRFGSLYVYLTLGLAHFGTDSVYGLGLERSHLYKKMRALGIREPGSE